MIAKIGLTEIHIKQNVTLLSVILSDEMTLYIKSRKFHWNVAGENFMELHQLFESQYTELEQIIDEVAERISKLGGKAIGTMNEFTLLSSIIEHPNKYPVKKAMISELLSDNETIVFELRKDIDICAKETHDVGTADLLTSILLQDESMAWVLRKYLS